MPERIPVTTSSNCYVVHNIVILSFENRVPSPLWLEKGARNGIVQVGVAASISSRVGLHCGWEIVPKMENEGAI